MSKSPLLGAYLHKLTFIHKNKCFIHCLIYKVHAPQRKPFYFSTLFSPCQALFYLFSKVFSRCLPVFSAPSRVLCYITTHLPPLSTLFLIFLNFFSRFFALLTVLCRFPQYLVLLCLLIPQFGRFVRIFLLPRGLARTCFTGSFRLYYDT